MLRTEPGTMPTVETLPIRSEEDIVRARQTVRSYAVQAGMSLVDQTKLVTAASELARNALVYGGGGFMQAQLLEKGARKGVELVLEDKGPGIADIEEAMRDGFTSGGGLGLGLGGARRLVNEFDIVTEVGKGTRIRAVRWR